MCFCGKRRQNTLQAVVRTLAVLYALKRHLVCLGEICTQGTSDYKICNTAENQAHFFPCRNQIVLHAKYYVCCVGYHHFYKSVFWT